MLKLIIKESEIRSYIRSLIKEAIETEAAVENPDDIAERNKMLAGQPYDRSKFPYGGKSFSLERERRAQLGLPPLKKPKGGVIPRFIDADGTDITPGNSPEAIADRLNQMKAAHRDKMRDRYIKKADKETFMANRNLDGNADTPIGKYDKYLGKVEQDPVIQRVLAMSPEERAAEAEKQRKNRIQRGMDANREIRSKISKSSPLGIPSNREFFVNRIAELKKKQAALGEHCDANDAQWRSLDYIINDTKRILNKWFGGYQDDTSFTDADDEFVKSALNDIDAEKMSRDFSDEYGENVVDPSSFETNAEETPSNSNIETDSDNYEPLDDETPKKKKKKHNFDDAEEMGYFDDIDNW